MDQEEKDELQREEVRGIFVIGVIATLLVLVTELPSVQIITPELHLSNVFIGIIVMWGAYSFLMAVGMSRDIVRPTVAFGFRALAKLYFLFGITTTVVYPLFTILDYYYLSKTSLSESYITALAVAITLLLTFLMWRRE
jgi:uncharacterized membrane protein